MSTPDQPPHPPGNPIARNNEVIGSVASLVVLAVSIGSGVGVMLGTGVRGVAAIATALLVAGGAFSLLMLAVSGLLHGFTPEEQWQEEEAGWRRSMGLPGTGPESPVTEAAARRRVAVAGSLALLVGLAISVLPALA